MTPRPSMLRRCAVSATLLVLAAACASGGANPVTEAKTHCDTQADCLDGRVCKSDHECHPATDPATQLPVDAGATPDAATSGMDASVPGSNPRKVFILQDSSGTLQYTDFYSRRGSALLALLEAHRNDPNTLFRVLFFQSLSSAFPTTFAPASDIELPSGLDGGPGLYEAEWLGDLQGALEWAHDELLADLNRTPHDQRAQYELLLFTDGSPGPVCCTCQDESASFTTSIPFTCDAFGDPDPPVPVISVGAISYEQRFCEGRMEVPICNLDLIHQPGVYDHLVPKGNYNRSYQLDDLVAAMVAGATRADTTFKLSTVYLNNVTVRPDVVDLLGLNPPVDRAQLSYLTALGGGTFVEVTDPAQLDFTALVP